MKVKIGKYPDRLTCNIHTRLMERRYGFDWPETQTGFEKTIEKLEDLIQEIYRLPNLLLDRRERKVKVRIDPSDTFNMDQTLAHVVVPMLKQLQKTKHGSPHVEDDDVPDNLKSSSAPPHDIHDIDDNWHLRWEYVLGEIIWAFEQSVVGDWESQYYEYEDDPEAFLGLRLVEHDEEGMKNHKDRMMNGYRLFGKYYICLWD